jgi:hypothetical protein
MIFNFQSFTGSSATKNLKKYKCPLCNMVFSSEILLIEHVKDIHEDEIPEGLTVKQFIFNKRRGKDKQLCQICKINYTDWNEKLGRYNPICNDPACKAEMRRRFLENYKKKNGKNHNIQDPEYQKKMLHNRKTSGTYIFKDGTKVPYASKYERDFLECWELDLKMPGSTINECDIYFNYEWEGQSRIYIPDYYCAELNLIIEIKASDNKHPKILAVDKETEKLKDKAVMDSHSYNYIKIFDKKYDSLYELVNLLQNRYINDKLSDDDIFIVIPKDTRAVKEFEMPKLKFLQDKDIFLHNLMIKFYESLKLIELALVIDRDFVPPEYDTDEILQSPKTILRKDPIDSIHNSSKLNQIFKEFSLYYTKMYEKFINQDFLGVYLPLPVKQYSLIIIEAKDTKTVDKFTSLIYDHASFITIITKIGFAIIIHGDNYKKINNWINKTNSKEIRLELKNNLVPLPGTNQGNFTVLIDEERSNF